MNVNIFREYDIRGVVREDLTQTDVESLGRGIGTYLVRHGAKTATLGRDGRISSPQLRDYLIEGLTSTGLNMVDLGVIPTPLSYWSTHRMPVDGAVMITGSHTPPEYNGFKITLGTEAIYGAEILRVRDLILAGDFERGVGEVTSADIKEDYINDLAGRLHLKRPVRFAVDCGNGVGGLTASPLLRRIGCNPVMMFDQVDGSFPNHHPDPTIEANLVQLRQMVVGEGLELGIAYDGDADRIGVVDETGRVMWGDQILAVLSRRLLQEVPGATVIAEVKCSQLLFDDIARHGGKALMWKVGHSLIKSKMVEVGAELAGEMSGHIFYRNRFYGFDDAVWVTGRLLEIVADSDIPVSRFLEDWPKLYSTPEIRRDCPDEIKFEVVAKVRDQFRAKYQVVDVDGMRVIIPGGWGLLRASNTQPVVVLRFEADSPARLEEIRSAVDVALAAASGGR